MRLLQEPEVLTEIVDYLDSYSVLALLQALPSLQKSAVLITDHSMPPMFFGGLHDVERRIFKTTQQYYTPLYIKAGDGAHRTQKLDLPSFDKMVDTYPIKFFELALPQSLHDVVRKEPGLDHPSSLQSIDLDRKSFVFISFPFKSSGYGYWIKHKDDLVHRLDRFTSCKWHVGSRTFFCNEREVMDPSHPLVYLHPEYKGPHLPGGLSLGTAVHNPAQQTFSLWRKDILYGLETLRIENVFQLPRGLSFPNVAELSIIFNCSIKDTVRPEINDLYVPKVKTFIVHFGSQLPLFMNCTIGSDQDPTATRSRSPGYTKSFELASFKLLDHSNTLPPVLGEMSYGSIVDYIDLSFLSNFDTFVIGAGVPISAIDPKHLQSLMSILWHISSADDAIYHGAGPILAPSLFRLGIHITGPGVNLPTWDFKSPYELSLSISSLSLDVSISDFWRGIKRDLSACDIYSSPRLLGDINNLKRILRLTREDWIANEKSIIPGGNLKLIGFEMDFLKRHSEGEQKLLGDIELRDLILAPVIDRENLDPCDLCLSIDIFTVQMWSRSIQINPLLVGSSTSVIPEISLILNIPVIADEFLDFPCQLSISPLFKSCILNGQNLSMVPNVYWEEQIMKESSHRYHKRTRILSHRWDLPKHPYTEIPLDQCTNLMEKDFSVFSIPYLLKCGGDVIEPTALERWDPIFYNPYVKFPRDPQTYTVKSGHLAL